jgi:hypothetical protein
MTLRASTVEHAIATIAYRNFGYPRLLTRDLSATHIREQKWHRHNCLQPRASPTWSGTTKPQKRFVAPDRAHRTEFGNNLERAHMDYLRLCYLYRSGPRSSWIFSKICSL